MRRWAPSVKYPLPAREGAVVGAFADEVDFFLGADLPLQHPALDLVRLGLNAFVGQYTHRTLGRRIAADDAIVRASAAKAPDGMLPSYRFCAWRISAPKGHS
jgi:hypothetical protein